MICIKYQEDRETCKYAMPGDAGLCKAEFCQKSIDDINDILKLLLDKFEHICPQKKVEQIKPQDYQWSNEHFKEAEKENRPIVEVNQTTKSKPKFRSE